MLMVRDLEKCDQESLSGFIGDIYKEYPSAMWFEAEPTPEALSRLFLQKLSGMLKKDVADMVAVQDKPFGMIVGEVEIVRLAGPVGYVGIIIRKEHRGKGLGSVLLEHASKKAILLGITRLRAEVASGNNAAQEFFKSRGFSLEKDEAGLQKGILLFEKSLR